MTNLIILTLVDLLIISMETIIQRKKNCTKATNSLFNQVKWRTAELCGENVKSWKYSIFVWNLMCFLCLVVFVCLCLCLFVVRIGSCLCVFCHNNLCIIDALNVLFMLFDFCDDFSISLCDKIQYNTIQYYPYIHTIYNITQPTTPSRKK